MAYMIGIDVGTSSAKAVLIDELGDVLAVATAEYGFVTPKPLWAESDPEDWWVATVTVIRRILEESGIGPANISGLGLTGQMHGLVLLGQMGDVLRPCIMWNDQRTGDQCVALTKRIGESKVIKLTGNPILPGFTAPKILWVEENEPEVFAKTAKVVLPKDYIRYRLSGEFYSDVSDASGTSFLDVARRCWSEDMLSAAKIPRKWLPEVTESPVASTKVSGAAAGITGLPEGLPIVAGAGDQAAQAVGCGIVREGGVSATLGTSGVVFAHSDEYRVEPDGRLHAFCHAVPGKWHLMGVMLSAAGSFQWYRNTLGGEEMKKEKETGKDAYSLLTLEAAKIKAGSEGLIFLPYLTGERTPYPDPNAKGVFFGLTLRHTKAHFTRSVLEGVTFGLKDSVELMRGLGIEINEVVASGGGAKSTLWKQILADVFESRIVIVNTTEGAAYGAALLAGVGCGLFSSVEEACDEVIREREETVPSPNLVKYLEVYPRYRALYPLLKSEFRQ